MAAPSQHPLQQQADLQWLGGPIVSQPPHSSPDSDPRGLQVLPEEADVRASARRLVLSAERMLSVWTPSVHTDLLEDGPLLDVIKRFALGRQFAKVRVLSPPQGNGPSTQGRFVALGRRLASSIEFRTSKALSNAPALILIADNHSVLYCARPETWAGVASRHQPAIVRRYLLDFDASWNTSRT